jgi:sulfur-oxidizing protein SoxY
VKSVYAGDVVSEHEDKTTRREVLIGASCVAGGLAFPALVTVHRAEATPATMTAAIRKVVGQASVKVGKVKLEMPPLVENGNTVQFTVSVVSPMTTADYVKAIHVFTEKNPQPNIISIHLGPRAGRAVFTSRCRLADSEKVVAIAEMNDGSFWSDHVDVLVTIAACVEDGIP